MGDKEAIETEWEVDCFGETLSFLDSRDFNSFELVVSAMATFFKQEKMEK